MALRNLVRGQRRHVVRFVHHFDYSGHRGWGFGFDCDEHGVVHFDWDQAPARTNYLKCMNGELDVIDRGIERLEHSYWDPGYGICTCGQVVNLDGDTRGEGIDCICGRLYNSGGQELRPRNQWEENTDDDY